MRSENSEINNKRREWTQQIRKKEVNEYMKKRRYEMLVQNCIFGKDVEENQRVELLAQLVAQFSFDKAVGFFRELVEMDRTLSVFYDITGMNPASPPNILRKILEGSSDLQLESRIISPKSWKDRMWTSVQLDKLKNLMDCMLQWWQREQELIKNIIGLVHRIDNYNNMVRFHVMECVSFVASLLLLFETVSEILTQKASVIPSGEFSGIENQRGMCVSILHNFLAADDELLLPILEQFLDLNGLNCKMVTLYYNIFIIKGVAARLRIKMMQYFTAILESDCELFLEDHKELIYILHICGKSSPDFTGEELPKFLTISQKLIRLLNNLMKVLNLRYQNSGIYLQNQTCSNDDHDFVLFLASILDFLSNEQAGIRCLAQQQHLSKFLIAHVQLTTHQQSCKTTRILLGIVNRITYDHCGLHYFLNSTPRLLQQVVAIVSRLVDNKNYNCNDEYQVGVVESMLLVCSNLCALQEIAEMFLNFHLMNVASILFYKHQNAKGRNLRLQCQYLFLNLLLHLKYTFPKREDPAASLLCIFNSPSNLNMFYDLFKFIPDTRKIVNNSLLFLAFLLNIEEDNLQMTAHIDQLLTDSTLEARLRELTDCGDEQIEQRVYQVRLVGRQRSGENKQEWQYK